MTERYDVIVIGAGHNGLVCAAILAKAGKQVLMLEANARAGGAAVTREFAEGYSVSACAHLLYQLQPVVRRELGLQPALAGDGLPTVSLSRDGAHVRIGEGEVHGVSDSDAEEFRAFRKRMTRFSDLLRTYMNKPPPRLGTRDRQDLLTLTQLGFDIRRLGKTEMREFLRVIGMNIRDELVERFASGALKGALSLDAVLGTHLGPRSPNTMLTYLYRLAGNHGRTAIPKGGMGAVCDELAHAARSAGATVKTGTPVRRIIVRDGRVVGVETESGEEFQSYTIVSNADPKHTVLTLLGAEHVETGFAQRINRIRASGNAAKLHLALDGLPAIGGLSRKDFASRLVIAPDEHYVERAFNPAKYGEFSPEPVIEMIFPSFRDPSMAPAGNHVLSAVIQYAPYDLKGGWNDDSREALRQTAMRTLGMYAPDLARRVTASELLTPADIEREFHLGGGHWHHGELTLDQFFFVRPVGGAQQYNLPMDGLWLCGAGAHPGGNVCGAAGRNAARMILKREKMT